METLKIDLKNRPITSFEKGNSDKAVARPVCAVGLGQLADGYKVKALFKGQDARDVHALMTSRYDFQEQITSESVDISGVIREIRVASKEVILDGITEMVFRTSIEIKVK